MKLKKNIDFDKLRGGFYTPATIADFILTWAFNGNKNCDILEPSCGDGAFLKSIKRGKYHFNSVTAVEYYKEEADKAQKVNLDNTEVVVSDFHKYCNTTTKSFDIIVGNPPYIRYQYFDKEQQNEAIKIFNKNNIKYSKLMNSCSAFVVGCTNLLNPIGKLAFVLPSEILQVINAKVIREFLLSNFSKISIISFKKLVFEKTQQDVILLLCQKGNTKPHIEYLEVDDDKALKDIDLYKLKNPTKNIYSSDKWTMYFLEQEELDFIHQVKINNKFSQLNKYLKVEVGMTTGGNDFFTVDKNVVREYSLTKYAKPLLGRSIQVKGCDFSQKDWLDNNSKLLKANLLLFPSMKEIKNKKNLNYLRLGEESGVSEGYKCRIRDEWQIIPSAIISDAFFSRRNSLYAKMILNSAKAYSTDTMHRIWFKDNVNVKALIASYYNTITFIFVELSGRSFGGGALELMPSEVANLYIPYDENNDKLFGTIDNMLRKNIKIEKVLDYVDEIILRKQLKLSIEQIRMAKSIRNKLLNKRLNKK